MGCPNCGKNIPYGLLDCPFCSEKVYYPNNTSSTISEKAEDKGKIGGHSAAYWFMMIFFLILISLWRHGVFDGSFQAEMRAGKICKNVSLQVKHYCKACVKKGKNFRYNPLDPLSFECSD